MPSESSSSAEKPVPLTTPCGCGHTRNWHVPGVNCRVPGCGCAAFRAAEEAAACRCGHSAVGHYGSQGCLGEDKHCACKGYLPQGGAEEPKCGHAAWEERNRTQLKGEAARVSRWCTDCGDYLGRFEAAEQAPEEHRCPACGHSEGEGCGCPAHAFVSREHCDRCEGTWLIRRATEAAQEPQEDPYKGEAGNCGTCTSRRPEGEEEPGEGCAHCGGPHAWDDCQAYTEAVAAPPPRPPYAVAYSVGGQLFEAWLPGDATAVAEDGVLKIAHAGQVAGIVRVSPVKEG